MTVLSYIIIAVLQFLILYGIIIFIKYLLNLVLKNHPSQNRFFFFFDITKAIIWMAFVLLKVAHSLNDNYIIVGSVVFLIILLVWDFLKNFLFGLVIRIQYGFLVNQKIIYNGNSSKILHYFTTYIEVRSAKGERLNVKYSTLFSGSFTVVSADLFDVSQSILFKGINHDELFSFYKLKIMNHPLYIQNDNAVFNVELDSSNQYWLHLHFNVLSMKHVLIMNDFINNIKK
jgi:hypothetical protein